MNKYTAVYETQFRKNIKRYAALRQRLKPRIQRLLTNPYANTEELHDIGDKLNLRGCRSARLDRNFRIIFVICEECRIMPECEYCFCDYLSDRTVVFLTFGPHDKAYSMK